MRENKVLADQLKFQPLIKLVSKNERHGQSLNSHEWLNKGYKDNKFLRFTFNENTFYNDYVEMDVKYLKLEFVVNRQNVREIILEKETE
jgi:hypothetical protein